MKIALVSPYDFFYPGGVSEHISHLGRYFQRWGHEVRIIAPCSEDEVGEELPDYIINASGSILRVPFAGSVARVSISPRMYRRVKKVLQQERFDVLHIHEPLTPGLPWIVLRHSPLLPEAVVVGTFHAYRESAIHYDYGKAIFKRFIGRLDGRIAVSPAARDYIARYFPGDYRIIPNGIDVEYFANPRVTPIERYCDGKLNILFVGRLEPRKGFKYLLRAFPLVKEAVPEVRLLVVGAFSKEDKEPFVKYARRHHIRGVRFIGYVPDEDLVRYYHTCHVFCAPSTGFESFGIVLLEAMAAGRPIVASNIAGYRTVLQDGVQGLLVEPENEEALAVALIRLLRDPEMRARMGEQGRRTAHLYSWEKVARQVLECYEEWMCQKQNTKSTKSAKDTKHEIQGMKGDHMGPSLSLV